jgi:ornithine cyclodeaminase/alanine dehydrogenase-like protein (mu-crystallin family)
VTVPGEGVEPSTEDLTVFKSVGMAFEDLVVARAIVDAPPA